MEGNFFLFVAVRATDKLIARLIYTLAFLTLVSQVVCTASAVHQNQVNTIQKLTEDYNALKKTVEGGEFRTEESRKRKEMEESTTVAPQFGVWEQLEGICSKY